MSEPIYTHFLSDHKNDGSYTLELNEEQTRRLCDDIDKLERELNAANAEIARLRANTGCARNQTTTQFCHEAVDADKLRVDAEWERDKWRKVADQLYVSLIQVPDPDEEICAAISAYDAAVKPISNP